MLLKLFQYPQTNKFQSVPVPPIQKFQTVPEILILTELFQYPPPLPKNLKRFQYPLNPPPPSTETFQTVPNRFQKSLY